MTTRAVVATLAMCVALITGTRPDQAHAEQIAASARGRTSPPAAFLTFCSKNPAECARSGSVMRSVPLTPERHRELQQVNAHVNAAIQEVSDLEHHGQEDVWSIPRDGRGDCEDFALLKRKLLIQRGWPSSTLLMTVVGTPEGEGHAVLMVVTDAGDFVLDNKTSRIVLWSQTGYLFFSRVAQANPRQWEAIDGGNARYTAATRRGLQPQLGIQR